MLNLYISMTQQIWKVSNTPADDLQKRRLKLLFVPSSPYSLSSATRVPRSTQSRGNRKFKGGLLPKQESSKEAGEGQIRPPTGSNWGGCHVWEGSASPCAKATRSVANLSVTSTIRARPDSLKCVNYGKEVNFCGLIILSNIIDGCDRFLAFN